jgi:hypothetical protein
MISKQIQLTAAAAAVAAAFAAAPAHAYVIVGAGASSINNGLLNAIIQNDCVAGTITYYDNSTSSPANGKLANGTVFSVSCTAVTSTKYTSNPFNVSYDSTGGAWKAFTATTPAFFSTAQASGDPLTVVKTIDPALTSCSTSPVSNYTSKLSNGTVTTVTYQWGCSTQVVGSGGNSDTPTFGLTEGEPLLFANSPANQPLVDGTWNNTPEWLLSPFTLGTEYSGFGSGPTGGIQVFGVVEGIAVSGPLYAALQNDQLVGNSSVGALLPSSCGTGTLGSTTLVSASAACAPIISRTQYANIVSVKGGAAQQSAAPLFLNQTSWSDYSLEWARRDQGSGLQANTNALFINVACANSLTEAPDSPALPANSVQQGGGFANIITYSPSTTDAIERLQGYPTTINGLTNAYPTSGFVIGGITGEKYSSSSISGTGTWGSGSSSAPWGFLRLDGFLPLVANVEAGLYNYAVTDYLHCSSTASGDAAQLCLDMAGKTSGALSLQSFSTTGATGIYPLSAANGGVYYNNGKICSGLRHH